MTQIAAALFAWDAVEARSDLERFFLVRDHLPDSDLIAALEAKRGLGRDDYPVIPILRAVKFSALNLAKNVVNKR